MNVVLSSALKMNLTAVFGLCCAVLAVLLYYKKSYFFNCWTVSSLGGAVNDMQSVKNDLFVIGILSSQDHFVQRQSLRDTWLTLANGLGIKHYFLIGKTCPIHPEDRTSVLECEEWFINISSSSSEGKLLKVVNDNPSEIGQCPVTADGFTFIIHHDIVVHYLGIQSTALTDSASSIVRVVLVDSVSQEKIASTTFHQSDYLSNDYLWKKVKPVVLPTGFEGEIRIFGLSVDLQSYNSSFKLSASNGCIRITEVLIKDSVLKYSGTECSVTSFSYTVRDIESLRSNMNNRAHRKELWNMYVNTLQEKLQKEDRQKQDILFLDMIDVYRNLPTKMLMFYKWLAKQNTVYLYMLKTDDDTFIDIHKVSEELQEGKSWDWWSCFRISWPTQRVGKWKEMQYNKSTYPPFPSGAGYVLSCDVIRMIAKHAENLEKNYQGEDVALGIWLEEFNFTRHIGSRCYWACNKNCHENTCNAAQLSAEAMYTVWKNYREYGNILCPNKK